MPDLLPESAASFQVRADVVVAPLESGLQQVAAESASEAGFHVPAFRDEHERAVGKLLHHCGVHDIERRLVDQADRYALLLQANDRVECAIDDLAHGDDVATTARRPAYDVVLARLERLTLVQRLA